MLREAGIRDNIVLDLPLFTRLILDSVDPSKRPGTSMESIYMETSNPDESSVDSDGDSEGFGPAPDQKDGTGRSQPTAEPA